mgnify:CR=1 FL=1
MDKKNYWVIALMVALAVGLLAAASERGSKWRNRRDGGWRGVRPCAAGAEADIDRHAGGRQRQRD